MSRGPRQIASLVRAVMVAAAIAGACLPAATNTASRATSSAPPAGASARPSSTPRAFVRAIEAFAERAASDRMTYRVAFEGIARSSTHTLPIAGSMDVAGADFASSFTYDWSDEAPGLGKVGVQVRAVGGKAWIKRDGGWQSIKGYKGSSSYALFKSVRGPRDVRYVGSATVGKATYHRIAIPGALLMHPDTLPFLFAKEKVDETYLEVLIDDAGRPRSGTWSMRARARVGLGDGQLQRLAYDLDLTFSKVDAKISIKRP